MKFQINFLILLTLLLTAEASAADKNAPVSIYPELKTNSLIDQKTTELDNEPIQTEIKSTIHEIPLETPTQNLTDETIKGIQSIETNTNMPELKNPIQPEQKSKVENENIVTYKDSPLIVNIVNTSDGKSVYAQLNIEEQPDGIFISGKFKGVPNPGLHGIHIHEKGSCAEKGNAAGGHFNPDNRQHGDLKSRGHSEAHAGDMGNVEIDANGNGDFKFFLVASSLREGRYNVAGKAIILHEKADDFSQPYGNAGERIGCGIIPTP